MKKSHPMPLPQPIIVNHYKITHVIIGQHYLEKHAQYMNDQVILNLVLALDGGVFKADSTSGNIEYFVSDIQIKEVVKNKIYRLVWLFEGDCLEIIGVINAFRVKRKKK